MARQSYIRYKLYRQEANGTSVLIKEWTGQTGKIEFIDYSIKSGGSYRYYVIPEHPELSVNGKTVCGPVRTSAFVQVGRAEIVLDDIEFEDDL